MHHVAKYGLPWVMLPLGVLAIACELTSLVPARRDVAHRIGKYVVVFAFAVAMMWTVQGTILFLEVMNPAGSESWPTGELMRAMFRDVAVHFTPLVTFSFLLAVYAVTCIIVAIVLHRRSGVSEEDRAKNNDEQ